MRSSVVLVPALLASVATACAAPTDGAAEPSAAPVAPSEVGAQPTGEALHPGVYVIEEAFRATPTPGVSTGENPRPGHVRIGVSPDAGHGGS